MDPNPKRLTKEEHVGRVFNERVIVSLLHEEVINKTLIRKWLLRCQRCGTEQSCDQRWLRRTRCYSPECKTLPENKSLKKPWRIAKSQNTIPRIPERNVPPCDDPRWEKLVKPVFDSLPLHPSEINRCLTRHALAWMEEKEMVVFDPVRMVWEEHPEHLTERLIAAAKEG